MRQVSSCRPQPRSASCTPAERVHHAVEVGADPQAVQGDVVAGVDDGRDVVVRGRPRARRAGTGRRRCRRPGQRSARVEPTRRLRRRFGLGVAASNWPTSRRVTSRAPSSTARARRCSGRSWCHRQGWSWKKRRGMPSWSAMECNSSRVSAKRWQNSLVPQARAGVGADRVDVTGQGQRLAATSRPSPTASMAGSTRASSRTVLPRSRRRRSSRDRVESGRRRGRATARCRTP